MTRYFAYLLSIVFVLAPMAAHAATVTPGGGQVLINQGNGYVAISGPTTVAAGDTVMVYPGGSAQISYGNGCNTTVQAGSVANVSAQSPCTAGEETTQTEAGAEGTAGAGVDFTTVVIGAGVIAAGVGLAVAAGSGGDDDKQPASP